MVATEWNLATLEELEENKGTAKHRIKRQQKICFDMILVCRLFLHENHGFPTDGRVSRLMDAMRESRSKKPA